MTNDRDIIESGRSRTTRIDSVIRGRTRVSIQTLPALLRPERRYFTNQLTCRAELPERVLSTQADIRGGAFWATTPHVSSLVDISQVPDIEIGSAFAWPRRSIRSASLGRPWEWGASLMLRFGN